MDTAVLNPYSHWNSQVAQLSKLSPTDPERRGEKLTVIAGSSPHHEKKGGVCYLDRGRTQTEVSDKWYVLAENSSKPGLRSTNTKKTSVLAPNEFSSGNGNQGEAGVETHLTFILKRNPKFANDLRKLAKDAVHTYNFNNDTRGKQLLGHLVESMKTELNKANNDRGGENESGLDMDDPAENVVHS